MEINSDRAIILVIGLILFTNFTNQIINALITQDSKMIASPLTTAQQTPTDINPSKRKIVQSEKKRYPLVPDDPAKYGIISQSKGEIPRTQLEWDMFMDKAIVKSKILEDENAKPAIEKMTKTPADFQKREEEVENNIARFEQKLKENPDDEDALQRLQTLYMLKSLGKTLKDKVVTPPTPVPQNLN